MAQVDATSGRDAAVVEVVNGLSANERAMAAASYFSAFAWEPHLVDPGQLTASAFFALVLASEHDADGERVARFADPYLDSVEVELVEAPVVEAATAAGGSAT